MNRFGTARLRCLLAVLTVLLAAVLLAWGCRCNKSSKTEDPAGNGDATDGPVAWKDASIKPKTDPWNGPIKVKVGDWNAFQKLVDSHKGKVVVAGFWASWSDRISQIRHLARLQNKYRGKIIVLHVSVDRGEDPATKPDVMRPKLEKLIREWVGRELPREETVNLFISSQLDEEFYAAAQTIEAVPTVFVYDRSGKRKKISLGGEKVIDGGANLVPLLDEMLK